jgi:hypothetical protein
MILHLSYQLLFTCTCSVRLDQARGRSEQWGRLSGQKHEVLRQGDHNVSSKPPHACFNHSFSAYRVDCKLVFLVVGFAVNT